MHEAVAVWDTTITHEDHDLMDSLGVLRQVIPEHGAVIGVCKVGGGVSLLGMDKVWELGRVSEEEDWCIVGDIVPVPFLSPELDGKASRIAGTIVRAGFATDGGEADRDRALLARLAPQVGNAEVLEGLCTGKGTVGATAFCVDDSLWDALAVEVGDQINEMEVLEEERTIGTCSLSLVGMWHWYAIAVCVDSFLCWCGAIIFIAPVFGGCGIAIGMDNVL